MQMNNSKTSKQAPLHFIDHADDAVYRRTQSLLKVQPYVLIAIDGNCCAGKTTAADQLGKLLQANVFHMDDYFLQPHMRTPERLAQPGGNVDAERFLNDILEPAARGKAAHVVRYDCRLDRMADLVEVAPRPIVVIEGAYSMHPLLVPYYDIRLFYRVDPALQIKRILARNGEEMLKMFVDRWIPLENAYFESLQIEQSCDFIVTSTQQ